MMGDMVKIMLAAFGEAKEKGSYVLFYLLALGLGLAVAWDRYGKSKAEDNWMVEEAKKQIQLWPFLYGLLALLLVVMNPLAIWLFNKKTAMEGQYNKVWGILLFLFVCAYGMVCFLSILREQKQKLVVVFGFVMLIGISGSSYGLMAERPGRENYGEEKKVVEFLQQNQPEGLIVATGSFLEYVCVHEPQMKVLYGKDMYTRPLDMGIKEAYPTQVNYLYELMKQPMGAMGELSRWAALCDCDVIVITYFENAPDKAGQYYKKEMAPGYLVYVR